jgi:poly-D-alanine transfer protein DltD
MYEKPLLRTTLKDLKKEVRKIKRSQSREVQKFVKNIEVTPELEADIKTLRESIQSQKQKVKVQRMGERKQKSILQTTESLAGDDLGTGLKRSQSENRLIESVDLVDGKGAAAAKARRFRVLDPIFEKQLHMAASDLDKHSMGFTRSNFKESKIYSDFNLRFETFSRSLSTIRVATS